MNRKKCVRLGNTVFAIESAMDLPWGENLQLFQTEGPADYVVSVRFTLPGEPTLHANGYANISREGRHIRVALPENLFLKPTAWQVLTLLPLSALLLEQGTLTLHGACVLYDGQGIVFSGPSGIGKSTQAELWRQHRGAKVVNGDRVFITPGGEGAVVSSHYLSGTSGICENAAAPLRAIVLLEQAGENGVRERSPLGIFQSIMSQLDYNVSVREQLTAVTGLVETLLVHTPVFVYGCRPDEEAVAHLEAYLNGVKADDREFCENNFGF